MSLQATRDPRSRYQQSQSDMATLTVGGEEPPIGISTFTTDLANGNVQQQNVMDITGRRPIAKGEGPRANVSGEPTESNETSGRVSSCDFPARD